MADKLVTRRQMRRAAGIARALSVASALTTLLLCALLPSVWPAAAAAAAAVGTPSVLTAQEIQYVLARRTLANPVANNMLLMKWDSVLASVAKDITQIVEQLLNG
jgi:hypothetical protein